MNKVLHDAVRAGKYDEVRCLIQTHHAPWSKSPLNRALRIACQSGEWEIAGFLIGYGADDFDGAWIASARSNNVFLLKQMWPYITKPDISTPSAFEAAIESNCMDTARCILSGSWHVVFGERLQDFCQRHSNSSQCLWNASQLLREYFLQTDGIYLSEFWAQTLLDQLHPDEYYYWLVIHMRCSFPEMAPGVIQRRFDCYYRFKGYLILHLPIPDLVSIACSYF